MKSRALLVSLLVGLSALAGCGSSNSSSGKSTNTTSTSEAPDDVSSETTAIPSSNNELCDSATLNGVVITALIVNGGADCSGAIQVASSAPIAARALQFTSGDYSCITVDTRKYTCTDSTTKTITFTAN